MLLFKAYNSIFMLNQTKLKARKYVKKEKKNSKRILVHE